MDAWIQGLFEREIITQCHFAAASAQAVNDALGDQGGANSIWYPLQNLLMAAANISKLIWGKDDPTTSAERASLRAALGLDDSEDFELQSRELRNDFEHFDERLTIRFSDPSVPRVYIGRNIGPPNAIQVVGVSPDSWFQHFDPETGVVSFWDRRVDLNKVMAEVGRIRAAASNHLAGES